MRILTFNVNSIRARHDRLLAVLTRHQPEVACLQELKVERDGFPFLELSALGYQAAVLGQKTYNGVALLSKHPIDDVREGLRDGVEDPQARLISVVVKGIRIFSAYVPNGSEVGSEKWTYKLAWLKRLRELLDREHRRDEPLALCGDFNVAPEDLDVQNVDRWRPTVLAHDEARGALASVRAFGLVDSMRAVRPDAPKLYSWWDYRQLGFPKNDGLRIDHIDITASLRERLVEVTIDREERKGKQPSDHAPVIADFREG